MGGGRGISSASARYADTGKNVASVLLLMSVKIRYCVQYGKKAEQFELFLPDDLFLYYFCLNVFMLNKMIPTCFVICLICLQGNMLSSVKGFMEIAC